MGGGGGGGGGPTQKKTKPSLRFEIRFFFTNRILMSRKSHIFVIYQILAQFSSE